MENEQTEPTLEERVKHLEETMGQVIQALKLTNDALMRDELAKAKPQSSIIGLSAPKKLITN